MNRKQRRAEKKGNVSAAQKDAAQWYSKGVEYIKTHNMTSAYLCFDRAVQSDKTVAEYWFARGAAAMRVQRKLDALHSFFQAHKLDPKSQKHIIQAAQACQGARINAFDRELKALVFKCLQNKDTDKQNLSIPWFDILKRDPTLKNIIQADALDKNTAILKDPYILDGLEVLMPNTQEMEIWLKDIRKALLEKCFEEEKEVRSYLAFAATLAKLCFATEYVFSVSEKERALLAKLKTQIEKAPTLLQIAIYGCYEPLYGLENATELEKEFKHTKHVSDLIAQQITEPKTEEEEKKSIRVLGQIDNRVSNNVKDMYEINPYPRWRDAHMSKTPLSIPNLKYLMAGCGTGLSTCVTAKLVPDATITAIDLSLASMSYAKRKAKEYGLKNVEFIQCDILNAPDLSQMYDVIESGGVLHHMEDPMAGWRALEKTLAPGGYMFIALYGKTARKDIFEAQSFGKSEKLTGSVEDIRLFREKIYALPETHPAKPVVRQLDFFSISNLRDLVFHPQERSYSLSEIQEALDEMDMECQGLLPLMPETSDLYLRTFPDDPKMASLANWQTLEGRYPKSSVGMYKFFCSRKKDKGIENAAVSALRAAGMII